MRQVLQSLRSGATEVVEIPDPAFGERELLIRSSRTLISRGTERALLQFGNSGWIEKARQQPDKVREVLEKIRTDGIPQTIDAVLRKLDQPLALGYCNVGVVIGVGSKVEGFSVGCRVVSNGKHAEVVAVPMNLCSRVPDGVADEAAVFTVAASIGLQGIRLIAPTLGESVVVSGLGLIGLLTVQLLRANGCRVLGLDLDPQKLALARTFGAEVHDISGSGSPVKAAEAFSRGRGVDAVIITASTTSSEPVHQGALMCRKRGRIVLVGVTGLELSRADFYEKELSFQVSCSYGPGRYDPRYEEAGEDYPVGFVRWTEQRNFEAVLDMMEGRRIDVGPLISHRFKLDDVEGAYRLIGGSEPSLGVILEYPAVGDQIEARSRTVRVREAAPTAARAIVGIIGAGTYAGGVLIPAFKSAGVRLKSVASASGLRGFHAARKYGFETVTSDADAILDDPEINTVVIATQHDSHARLVCRALRAGKHVFVEKPLALTLGELDEIEAVFRKRGDTLLTVGFNRRFAPDAVTIRRLLANERSPKAMVMTVNAGGIPATHWTQDMEKGGGRIIGEACHFVDLLRFLAASSIRNCSAFSMEATLRDTATLQLEFEDGSIGTIHYLANGHRGVPKERLEVFSSGRVLQLENFRRLTGYGWPNFSKQRRWRQDKGQVACAAAFVKGIEAGGPPSIPVDELFEVSRAVIDLSEQAIKRPVETGEPGEGREVPSLFAGQALQ